MLGVNRKLGSTGDTFSFPSYNPFMALHMAEFEHGGIRVLGRSSAGEQTFLVLPDYDLALDIGLGEREVVAASYAFLTHGHIDHAAGIAYYLAQRNFLDQAPGRLFVPEPLVAPIHALLDIWAQIDGARPPGTITPAHDAQDVEIRRGLLVRPFRVEHPGRGRRQIVTALGYSLIEVRQKLRPEFSGLSGPEIVRLKAQGVVITERTEIPLVAYTGDTGPGDFLSLPHVRDARVLLIECTFIDEDHRRRARAGNHMHVRDIADAVRGLRNERIVLTHLTRRTTLPVAREALRRELPAAELDRVSFLMEHRRRRKKPEANEPRPAADA